MYRDTFLRGIIEDVQEAYVEIISTAWHQGTVSEASAPVLEELVAIAEEATGVRATTAAAAALLIASGDSSGPGRAAIGAALTRLRPRLEKLALRDGLLGRAMRLCVGLADASGFAERDLDRVFAIASEAETVLDEASRREYAEARRSPAAIERRIRACVFQSDADERVALGVIADCLEVGRYEDALALCARLTRRSALAEPHRVRALAGAGRVDEATEAAIALTRAWLAPATSAAAANQAFLASEILAMLRALPPNSGRRAEIDALVAAVESARPEVSIPEGDFF